MKKVMMNKFDLKPMGIWHSITVNLLSIPKERFVDNGGVVWFKAPNLRNKGIALENSMKEINEAYNKNPKEYSIRNTTEILVEHQNKKLR